MYYDSYKTLKVLIACERSGIVRDAFASYGVDAISADLLPTARPGKHYIGNVLDLLCARWDLIIGFPPCDLLCNAAQWLKPANRNAHEGAINFFLRLYTAHASHIAIENPVGTLNTAFRRPSQIIHPYQFGDNRKKQTCLWLRNLPKLIPTVARPAANPQRNNRGTSKNRSMLRSQTFPGIAAAMAAQWLPYIIYDARPGAQQNLFGSNHLTSVTS